MFNLSKMLDIDNHLDDPRTEESVHQTASVLSQCLVSASSSAAPRKLVGRSLHTLNSLHTQPQQQSSSQVRTMNNKYFCGRC